MKKLYFIRHIHGQYVGSERATHGQSTIHDMRLVSFEKARVFMRRSDATLAFKSATYDEDLYYIAVLEVSEDAMKHSTAKPANLYKKMQVKVPTVMAHSGYMQGIHAPDEEVLPELILSTPSKTVVATEPAAIITTKLDPYTYISTDAFAVASLAESQIPDTSLVEDEHGTYVPSYSHPTQEEVVDNNKGWTWRGRNFDWWRK